jgi:hypothetical protein
MIKTIAMGIVIANALNLAALCFVLKTNDATYSML